MPLSEEELRLLEQMERALVEEDPKFASTLRGTRMRQSARRRAVLAGVVFVAGIVVLMTGAVIAQPVVGIAGFVLMLGSATVALGSIRGQQQASAEPRETGREGFAVLDGGRRSPRRPGRGRGRTRGSHGSFMERVEERWRRRRERGGF